MSLVISFTYKVFESVFAIITKLKRSDKNSNIYFCVSRVWIIHIHCENYMWNNLQASYIWILKHPPVKNICRKISRKIHLNFKTDIISLYFFYFIYLFFVNFGNFNYISTPKNKSYISTYIGIHMFLIKQIINHRYINFFTKIYFVSSQLYIHL